MRNIMAIADRELRSYFSSPIAYIIIGFFLLPFGVFFYLYLAGFVKQSLQMAQFGGAMNITFMADDVEATAKELKERGVEFAQDPQKTDWGTVAIFKDVDDNVFVLSTP